MARKTKASARAGAAKRKSAAADSARRATAREGGASGGAVGGAPSPFETRSVRNKFEVLGRAPRGAKATNQGKSRSAAVRRRDATLLEEFKRVGKAGAFVDRRFGEGDASVAPEERAAARMRKVRLRDERGGSSSLSGGRKARFTLGGGDAQFEDDSVGDEDVLTHGGAALAELDDYEAEEGERGRLRGGSDDDDDDDGDMDRRIVDEYHFGGGFVPKRGDAEDGDQPERRKTKKEVMDEIIAKSKFYRRQRAKEKEEDEDELERLDATFKEIQKAGGLQGLLRKGRLGDLRASSDAEGASASEPLDEYDKAAHALTNDARARPSERVRTEEERAAEEAAKLAELERRRRKRMELVGSDDDVTDDDEAAPKGGFALRRYQRKKQANGVVDADDMAKTSGAEAEDDFVLDDDGDGGNDRDSDDYDEGDSQSDDDDDVSDDADPNDPDGYRKSLKRSTRQMSSSLDAGMRLLKEKGILEKMGIDSTGILSDDEGEDEGTSGSEEEGDDQMGEGDSSPEHEIDSDADGAYADVDARVTEGKGPGKQMMTEEERARRRAEREAAASELPYSIPVPETWADFAKLVDGRSAGDVAEAIRRIRACNAAVMDRDQNRKRLQVFYGVLLRHFESLAGEVPLRMDHIDCLISPLMELTAQLPFYAATAARARLMRMQQGLAARLQNGAAPWPPARTLLLLKLFSLLFPTSDFRHPVATPAALIVGQLLAICPVTCTRDVSLAVFAADIALGIAEPAHRYVPEAVSLLSTVVASACSPTANGGGAGLLHVRGTSGKRGPTSSPVEALTLRRVLETPPGDDWFASDAFKRAVLGAALCSLRRHSELCARLPACAELLGPVAAAVGRIGTGSTKLPSQLEAARAEVAAVAARAATTAETREPVALARANASTRSVFRTFNPQFEEAYEKGRDYDPDAERAERRKVQRAIKKEQRGAVRELRLDGRYLAEARAAEVARVDEERVANQKRAFTILQQQEADMKSGGQGGMHKAKKRRAG